MNNNFTTEQLEKAKTAKTVEELIEIAKAENIVLSHVEATNIFAKLNPENGQLSDDELRKVSGGLTKESANSPKWCPRCECWMTRTTKCAAVIFTCPSCGGRW